MLPRTPSQGIHLTLQGLLAQLPYLLHQALASALHWCPSIYLGGPFTPAVSPVKPASPTGNLYPHLTIQVFQATESADSSLPHTPGPQACWFFLHPTGHHPDQPLSHLNSSGPLGFLTSNLPLLPHPRSRVAFQKHKSGRAASLL